MRFASVAEIKDGLSEYLARAKKRKEPIVVTHHGKPYALIQPLEEADLEELEWKQLARRKLARAWEGEEDALYDYLVSDGREEMRLRIGSLGGCPPKAGLSRSRPARRDRAADRAPQNRVARAIEMTTGVGVERLALGGEHSGQIHEGDALPGQLSARPL